MTIIALYSPSPHCGKSTIAAALAHHWGYCRISFADPLRRMVRAMMLEAGLTEDGATAYLTVQKNDPIHELGGRSARYLLRTIGTEWGRDMVDVGIWTSIAMQKIDRLRMTPQVVIDDLRFPSEREELLRRGALLWKVTRPGHEVDPEHRSDGAMEGPDWGWDRVIVNDGTLEDLIASVC